jgi:hypothetical protein
MGSKTLFCVSLVSDTPRLNTLRISTAVTRLDVHVNSIIPLIKNQHQGFSHGSSDDPRTFLMHITTLVAISANDVNNIVATMKA